MKKLFSVTGSTHRIPVLSTTHSVSIYYRRPITIMSQMTSWSRPAKSQPTPAPFYLLPGGEATAYCRSCGRVISSRQANAAARGADTAAQTKHYCSTRCRHHKPRKLDREIEDVFARRLSGEEKARDDQGHDSDGSKRRAGATGSGQKAVKGESRILVSCDEVERVVFGERADPEKTSGRGRHRGEQALLATGEDGDARSSASDVESGDAENGVDIDEVYDVETSSIDGDVLAQLSVRSGTRVRLPQTASQVNGSIGGEKGKAERSQTEDMARRRLEGQKRAQQREMVRCAARRGVIFGFIVKTGNERDGFDETRRKCEAVMQGKVVEPSFAKGDWSIRWREREYTNEDNSPV
ncbi:hypothetical protein F5B20DRAFT_184427 [Whalleya microplaca]|nr:hypothetical protein F5B20DRAFT_184427 [Whalleya microplaca]